MLEADVESLNGVFDREYGVIFERFGSPCNLTPCRVIGVFVLSDGSWWKCSKRSSVKCSGDSKSMEFGSVCVLLRRNLSLIGERNSASLLTCLEYYYSRASAYYGARLK